MNKLSLVKIRDLLLERPMTPGLPSHVSAASGLVTEGDTAYVAPDDSLHLGVFCGPGPGHGLRLFDRPDLPADEKERKAVKPDLESLARFQAPNGPLLVSFGSGSRPNRREGVAVRLDQQGRPTGEVQTIDLSPLYLHLEETFPRLNIEGIAPCGERFRLVQRGNGEDRQNAVIDLDLQATLTAIVEGRPLGPELLVSQRRVDLGQTLADVPWTFTDVTSFDHGRTLFAAAAEATASTYEDGQILGSLVGVLEADGSLGPTWQLDLPVKVEGLDARETATGWNLRMVTDPDDPERAAEMFSADLGPV
ncbi:MAG: hypothetical protein AB7S38_29925 [Vulcanimicrobiota bacterium]